MQIDPAEYPKPKLHQLLLGAVAPRPIAFASTLDSKGRPNLSPFSFFNAFGVNPATLVFSPSRRGRDNTTKDTFENVKAVPEVVINVVTREIVQQASLASTEYATGVNEFLKAGLTMLPSVKVKPFRVMESPVQFECRVKEVIETGDQGGAGNLVVCEILLMHVNEDVVDEQGLIDPGKIRLVGRLGGDHYCEAFGNAIFDVEKPLARLGLGVDQLPQHIRFSKVLTGNDLGQLANIEALPGEEMTSRIRGSLAGMTEEDVHHFAKKLIADGRIIDALAALMTLGDQSS